MKPPDMKRIKKILVIRPRAIGDVVLTTPFLRALRKAAPDAVIDYVVEPFVEPSLRGNPNINNILVVKRHKLKKEPDFVKGIRKNELKKAAPFVKIIETARFYGRLISGRYDIVFDLWGNLRTAIMSFLTGARYRAGFTRRFRSFFYNVRVKPDIVPKYNVYYHMDLLKALGIEPDGEETEFYPGIEDGVFADSYISGLSLPAKRCLICLNPLGTWETKRWPEEKFSELAGMIINRIEGSYLIVNWGPGERHHAAKVCAGVKGGEGRVFMAPETTIKQLGALLKRMDAVVTNDGAPKHIAVAVKTPTVTVHGPTDYRAWGPSGNPAHRAVFSAEPCAPCEKMRCVYEVLRCMEGIKPEKVYEELLKILKINNQEEHNG